MNQVSGEEHRLCQDRQANEEVGFLPFGVWTQLQRKSKGDQVLTRYVGNEDKSMLLGPWCALEMYTQEFAKDSLRERLPADIEGFHCKTYLILSSEWHITLS